MWFSDWIKMSTVSLIQLNLKLHILVKFPSQSVTTHTIGTVIYFMITVLEFCGITAFAAYCANRRTVKLRFILPPNLNQLRAKHTSHFSF